MKCCPSASTAWEAPRHAPASSAAVSFIVDERLYWHLYKEGWWRVPAFIRWFGFMPVAERGAPIGVLPIRARGF